MKLEPQFRNLEIRSVDKESKTIELSFSSEDPYERYWGIEILDHGKKSVDLSRLNNGASVLFNHNRNEVVGVVSSAKIENKRGVATIRFGNSNKAKEVWEDVKDGILKNVSIGYKVTEVLETKVKGGLNTYRATKWLPYEISIVTIPADATVGIGRSDDDVENEVNIINNIKGAIMPGDKIEVKTTDSAAVANLAREAERTRINEITAMSDKFHMKDLASKAISEDMSADTFRVLVLEKMEARGTAEKIDTKSSEIGLDVKDLQRYSFARAIEASITGNWGKAGLELEASNAVSKKTGVAAKGFLMPHDVLQKDLMTSNEVSAGNLVSTNYMGGSFIEMLQNKLIINQLGGMTLTGLSGNVAIPKQTGSSTAYWINEGEDVTDSLLKIGLLNLSPKTIAAAMGYSRNMLLQANSSIEALVMKDIALAIALGLDKATINGAGAKSKEPLGILNQTGIGAIDCKKGMDWARAVEFETAIKADNADVNTMNYVTNAAVAGLLKTNEKSVNTARYLLENKQMNGYGVSITNQVPDKSMVFGDWSQVISALWGGLDIVVDTTTKASSGGVIVRAFQSADIGLRYAESFSASNNIKV